MSHCRRHPLFHLLRRLFGCGCCLLLAVSVASACPVQTGSAFIAAPSFVQGYSQAQSFATVAAAAPCACGVQTQAAAVESYAQPQVIQSYAQPLAVAYAQPITLALPVYSNFFATPFYGYNASSVFVGSSRGRLFGGRQVSRQRSVVTTTRTRTVVRGR